MMNADCFAFMSSMGWDEYARHLEELGVAVTIIDDVELGDIKQQAGVSYGLGSCHTIEIG